MFDYIAQIVIGLIVIIIAAWFGIGRNKTTIMHTQRGEIKKTGKRIMIISVVIVIWGLLLLSNNPNANNENIAFWIGVSMIGYGVIFFIIGKIVAWCQRP